MGDVMDSTLMHINDLPIPCRECRRAVLHDYRSFKANRVYFTASILIQWLAHTLLKIVTFLNL